MQMAHCAKFATDVHTFWPSSRHPPSTRVARVVSAARSDPAPGSLNSWHQMISPRSVGSTKRSRCASVPYLTSVGTTQLPMTMSGSFTFAAVISCAMTICSTGPAERP